MKTNTESTQDNQSTQNDVNGMEKALINVVNKAINKTLCYDLEAAKKLDAFANKVIRVNLLSTPFEFFIHILDRQVVLSKFHHLAADTTIKGTPLALFAMQGDEPIAGIKNVEIFGDASTGQFFAKWLKSLNPDWQEAWCDILGDGMGVRVSNAIGGLLGFGKKLKQSLLQNSKEYLQEESRDLVTPVEMEDFLDDVDDIKADVERLQQQLNALKIGN